MITRLELIEPGQIDGDPEEVAADVRAQLRQLSEVVEAYAIEARKQIRNAHGTELLSEKPSLTGADIARDWITTGGDARTDQLVRAARLFRQAARGI